jgi:Peptidase family C54
MNTTVPLCDSPRVYLRVEDNLPISGTSCCSSSSSGGGGGNSSRILSGMSTLAATSIFRKPQSNGSGGGGEHSNNDAVLVTAPRITNESSEHSAAAIVESETYQDVNVSGNNNNPLRRFLESGFYILSKKSEEQEMNELSKRDDPVQIKSPLHKRDVIDTFDICREYSYSGDDDDNEELNRRYFYSDPPTLTTATPTLLGAAVSAETFVLGKTYHPIHDYNARRSDESSLFWFTYRCDFPCMEPYGITSDAGWGCMLRALQMLCGQAMRLHFKSRDWRPPSSPQQGRQDPFLRSVLTWFADFPSASESFYSLHNMVAAGLAKYDKLPGEWYGPGTACYVLRDLAEIHEKHQQQSEHAQHRRVFRVHVAAGGTVYRDAIEECMTKEATARLENERQENAKQLPPPAHPLAVPTWELLDPLSAAASIPPLEWDTALLLLIPLRLGLKHFNADYVKAVAHTFSLPQSVGVLGGRPRGARWFYGALSDGSKVFGLDPHTVQSAPKRRSARVNGSPSSVVELSDDYLRSVHTTFPEVYAIAKMDPSIALGFYCRGRSDLENVFSSLRQWKANNPNAPELFTVADKTPIYSINPSATVLDEMLDSMVDDPGHEETTAGDGGEEDEFIML